MALDKIFLSQTRGEFYHQLEENKVPIMGKTWNDMSNAIGAGGVLAGWGVLATVAIIIGLFVILYFAAHLRLGGNELMSSSIWIGIGVVTLAPAALGLGIGLPTCFIAWIVRCCYACTSMTQEEMGTEVQMGQEELRRQANEIVEQDRLQVAESKRLGELRAKKLEESRIYNAPESQAARLRALADTLN